MSTVSDELTRVRREALELVDQFHTNGMARSREGDEGAAAAYDDAGRDLSSLIGQSLDRSSRTTDDLRGSCPGLRSERERTRHETIEACVAWVRNEEGDSVASDLRRHMMRPEDG